MLSTVNAYDPREQRALKALEILDAALANGRHLLQYVVFAGVFLMKMIEFRREPFFREGRVNMPCPCRFSYMIKDALKILRLGDLGQTRWPLVNSMLERYYIRGDPSNRLVSVLDDLDTHLRASNRYLSSIRFRRSLEDRATDLVYDVEYQRPSPSKRDHWHLGAFCLATWAGDDHAFRHDAKIVWISKFRRTCRIVYENWNGWGWETAEYPVLIKSLEEHDNLLSSTCPLYDQYDGTHDILCH